MSLCIMSNDTNVPRNDSLYDAAELVRQEFLVKWVLIQFS